MQTKDQFRCAIPGEHIPTALNQVGRVRIERIDHALEHRSNLLLLRNLLSRPFSIGQEEEMPFLGSREPERLRQAGKHLPGGMNILPLFQQRIPMDRD